MQQENEEKVYNLIERLKEERLKQGLSQERLALKAKIHRTSVGHIEAHQMSPTLLMCLKIASALNINLKDLL
ncbi:MAG: helix-turn-helix transcriptional regulator [Alphaproteobacteria bacterium]